MASPPSKPKDFLLYRFEYVPNSLGVWDQRWFDTSKAAHDERRRLIREEGFNPKSEMDGAEGCIGKVHTVLVTPTLAGLLAFAEHYACDQCGG